MVAAAAEVDRTYMQVLIAFLSRVQGPDCRFMGTMTR